MPDWLINGFLIALACVLLMILTGCAGGPSYSGGDLEAGPGQAAYHYTKTADGGCEVVVTSAREPQGIHVVIDENCAVTVSAEVLAGQQLQLQQMGIIGDLVHQLIGR